MLPVGLLSKLALPLTLLLVLGLAVAPSEQAGEAPGDTDAADAEQLDEEAKAKLEEKKHSESEFYHFMRPRLGYFTRFPPTHPYFGLFEAYFANVVKNNDAAMRSIDINDWRQRRPHAEFCVELLIGFQVDEYVLSKPYDLIPLDACLDWLFDKSDQKELDLKYLSKRLAKEVKGLQKVAKLRELHEQTGFREPNELQKRWPKKLLTDLHGYLTKLLRINNDNPTSGCHSLWLEAYNDFIEEVYVGEECDDEEQCQFYGIEDGQRDSYLTLIAESTKHSATVCYGVMQTQMRELIVKEYESSKSMPATFKKTFITKTNRVDKQSEREKWSREMIGILQIASGLDSDQPINLGDAVLALDKIKNSDADTVERFTKALAEYAQNNADMKDSANDPNGSARYGRAMTKLCRPYIDATEFLAKVDEADEAETKPFEFYNLIYSLVRITNHEPILGISKNKLEDDIVTNEWEPLYLATFACQIISTTWGTLTNVQNSLTFAVKMRPNARLLIEDWPIEVMVVKLPILNPKQEVSSGFSLKTPKLIESFQQKPLQFHSSEHHHGEVRGKVKNFRKKFGKLFGISKDQQLADGQHHSSADFMARAPKPQPIGEAPYDFGQDKADATETIRAAPKPVYTPPMSSAQSSGATPAKPVPKNVLPLRSILYYRDLHGRFPVLPDNIHEFYPELPKDLSGTYPKLSLEELREKYPIQDGWRVAKGPFENHEKEAQQASRPAANDAPPARPSAGFIRPRGAAVSERVSRFESGRPQQQQQQQQQQQRSGAQADRWTQVSKMKI